MPIPEDRLAFVGRFAKHDCMDAGVRHPGGRATQESKPKPPKVVNLPKAEVRPLNFSRPYISEYI